MGNQTPTNYSYSAPAPHIYQRTQAFRGGPSWQDMLMSGIAAAAQYQANPSVPWAAPIAGINAYNTIRQSRQNAALQGLTASQNANMLKAADIQGVGDYFYGNTEDAQRLGQLQHQANQGQYMHSRLTGTPFAGRTAFSNDFSSGAMNQTLQNEGSIATERAKLVNELDQGKAAAQGLNAYAKAAGIENWAPVPDNTYIPTQAIGTLGAAPITAQTQANALAAQLQAIQGKQALQDAQTQQIQQELTANTNHPTTPQELLALYGDPKIAFAASQFYGSGGQGPFKVPTGRDALLLPEPPTGWGGGQAAPIAAPITAPSMAKPKSPPKKGDYWSTKGF